MDGKPTGPKVPARSLAESEWLLEQDRARDKSRSENKAFAGISVGLAAVVLTVVCVVGAIIGVANILIGPFFR